MIVRRDYGKGYKRYILPWPGTYWGPRGWKYAGKVFL